MEDRTLLAAMVDRMDTDALAATIVDRHLPSIPGYARMSEQLLVDQILPVVRRNLDLFLTCLVEGREPGPDDIEALRSSATRRGREGMPVEDLLRGYRLGARISWDALVRSCADPEEQRLLLEIAERLMGYLDLVSTAVAQAYVDEREQLVSEHERWARALLEGLQGEMPVEEMRLLAERTGVALGDLAGASYRPFAVARLVGSPRDHAGTAIGLRSRGVLALTEGDRVCGIVPVSTGKLPLAADEAAVTLGAPCARAGLADGLALARLRVDTARRLGRVGTIGEFDLLPELLLVGSPHLARSVDERVLAPLTAYDERRRADLVHTLETYVAAGRDRRGTAVQLSVHPNTLDYRLQKIEALARLDLSDPGDLTLVYLALRQRRLAVRPGR